MRPPNISRVAILAESNGGSWGQRFDGLQSAAAALQLKLLLHDVYGVKTGVQYDAILSKMIEEGADSLYVFSDFVNIKYQNAVIGTVLSRRWPCMTNDPEIFRRADCLLFYYTDWQELRRRAAGYVDKIFKEAKPADLPVEQPSRFELIVNLKTAHALGLTIPQAMLGFADKVIE
jgi:ABC-type uncharacterized transport system substrate-binding protein